MKTLLHFLLGISLLFGVSPLLPRAGAAVDIRLSVKIFLDSTNGWPVSNHPYRLTSEPLIRQRIADYNRLLDRMARGFHLQVTEVVPLSGTGWEYADASEDLGLLNEAINQDPGKFQYRPNRINVYINGRVGRSAASGDQGLLLVGDRILLNQPNSTNDHDYLTLLHEVGHTMSLMHTHGACNDPADCGNRWRNDDDCVDTLPDYAYTSRDEVAQHNFGNTYSNLPPSQQWQVDNLFRNLMSYHEPLTNDLRITHDQWERIVDCVNDPLRRRLMSSGSTVFVDSGAPGLLPCEVESKLAELLKDLVDNQGAPNWPVVLYQKALASNPIDPETKFRRTCSSFDIKPGWPDKPDWWPSSPDGSSWAWPPVNPPFKPAEWPDDWPWPPAPPSKITVCVGGAYRTLADALNCAAVDGDRLQIKAGHYNEKITRLSRPMTLTADRAKLSGASGSVTIGRD